eukprot:TRINITY_DN3441_c0_g1_i1.p1 TRINITY_DN3441_c0_g1~~TRINITY_DN3441_c0_g1_i1.p1  ORF type:complete len:154 (+),score=2.79 TRINITY_DN3441_c0_g1_i1:100-561(+)
MQTLHFLANRPGKSRHSRSYVESSAPSNFTSMKNASIYLQKFPRVSKRPLLALGKLPSAAKPISDLKRDARSMRNARSNTQCYVHPSYPLQKPKKSPYSIRSRNYLSTSKIHSNYTNKTLYLDKVKSITSKYIISRKDSVSYTHLTLPTTPYV